MTSEQHRRQFPESYEMMKSDPLRWTPPGGNSIIDIAEYWRSFYEDIKEISSVIIVGHRDQMWAAMQPLENLSDEELLAVNTDNIHNAQVVHYTSINPETGRQGPMLDWKRSIDPTSEVSVAWEHLPNVPETV